MTKEMNNKMAQVLTAIGLVERDQLTVKDVIDENDSSRVTATEWYLGDQLVRRDVNVNVLTGILSNSENGGM